MGRNSQQRRAEKLRREARQRKLAEATSGRAAGSSPGGANGSAGSTNRDPGDGGDLGTRISKMILEATSIAATEPATSSRWLYYAERLEVHEHSRPSALAVGDEMLVHVVGTLFENGWQPADLIHVERTRWNNRVARLLVDVIAEHSRRNRAPDRAPAEWLDQLADLGVFDSKSGQITGGHGESVVRWAKAERLHFVDAAIGMVQLVAHTMRLPRLPQIAGPPSAWPASNRGGIPLRVAAVAAGAADVDPKMLGRIRALLAKAEATTFEEEADAFSSKAQDLMTRFSIDAAFVAASGAGGADRSGVISRRIHIDKPYADEKATLLAVVANANDCRAIWSPDMAISTVMGFPVDIGLVELLYTSLLVQATRASEAATKAEPRLRTAAYRRAFLLAYADRIGERLDAARHHAEDEAAMQYGSSLELVLADKSHVVSEAFHEAFPNSTQMRQRTVNAEGYRAGRAAADRATINRGKALPGRR